MSLYFPVPLNHETKSRELQYKKFLDYTNS